MPMKLQPRRSDRYQFHAGQRLLGLRIADDTLDGPAGRGGEGEIGPVDRLSLRTVVRRESLSGDRLDPPRDDVQRACGRWSGPGSTRSTTLSAPRPSKRNRPWASVVALGAFPRSHRRFVDQMPVGDPRWLAPLDRLEPGRQVVALGLRDPRDLHRDPGDRPAFEVDDPAGDRHVRVAALPCSLSAAAGFSGSLIRLPVAALNSAQVDHLARLGLQVAGQLERP